jgi:hypothetical protein
VPWSSVALFTRAASSGSPCSKDCVIGRDICAAARRVFAAALFGAFGLAPCVTLLGRCADVTLGRCADVTLGRCADVTLGRCAAVVLVRGGGTGG